MDTEESELNVSTIEPFADEEQRPLWSVGDEGTFSAHPTESITFMSTVKSKKLMYLFCTLVDFPENQTACASNNSTICFSCPITSTFHLGGGIDDMYSSGHIMCTFIWTLILLFGLLGIVMNSFVISISRRLKSTKAFDKSIMFLAVYDLICVVMAVISATGMVTFFNNWDREFLTQFVIYLAFFISLFGRTGSALTTVVIAAERYIFLAHPSKSSTWLTSTKARIAAMLVLIISVILNFPRFVSIRVGPVVEGSNQTLLNLSYIMHTRDAVNTLRFGSSYTVYDKIDLWLPLPLLLLFYILIMIEIKKITRKRKELQVTRKKDVREVQMFLPAMLVLFFCNCMVVAYYMVTHITRVVYREQVLAVLLSMAVNSTIKLPIYYLRGSTFRKEARARILEWTQGGK